MKAILSLLIAVLGTGNHLIAQEVRNPGGARQAEEASLRARVHEWWAARQERDHLAMYELFEPEYRANVPLRKFLQESVVRSRFDIASSKVVKTEGRETGRVAVFVEIVSMVPQFGGAQTLTVEEPWVRVSGEWYKVHQPFRPPFPDTSAPVRVPAKRDH